MKSPWKKLTTRITYRNPWIKVRQDRVIRPDGKWGIYGYLDVHHSAMVIGLTEKREVVLVRQWRYIFGKQTLELPWGSIGSNESPPQAAKREFSEEAGYTARRWLKLGTLIVCPGLSNECVHIYYAQQLSFSGAHPEETESITVKKVPLATVYRWCGNGTIYDSCTLAAISLAKKRIRV